MHSDTLGTFEAKLALTIAHLPRFHVDIFADGGVAPSKLIVVPESVDTDFFNPDSTQPLSPSNSYGIGEFLVGVQAVACRKLGS